MPLMWETFTQVWPIFATALDIAISLTAATHVVLYKRNTRAAIGWVGIIWFAPIIGSLLYVCFGVNRIQRRAQSIWKHKKKPSHSISQVAGCSPETLRNALGIEG